MLSFGSSRGCQTPHQILWHNFGHISSLHQTLQKIFGHDYHIFLLHKSLQQTSTMIIKWDCNLEQYHRSFWKYPDTWEGYLDKQEEKQVSWHFQTLNWISRWLLLTQTSYISDFRSQTILTLQSHFSDPTQF